MDACRDAILDIQSALPVALGDDLLALYFSDGRLWLCIRPETEMQRVREAFLPLWTRYAGVFTHGPAVATPADLNRYSQFFPDHIRRLWDEAQLMAGADVLRQAPKPAPPDPVVQLAQIAAETMRCSALLVPTVSNAELERRLLQVATRQAGLALTTDPPPLEILDALHTYLAEQSGRYPAYHWDAPPPAEAPPAHLPGLLALVGLDDKLIIVMPQVDRPLLTGIDWNAVVELVSYEFTGVILATPWQLRLAATVELALELYLGSFELVWGNDLLADCQPAERSIMARAAALPVCALVEQLPAGYLTVEEAELGQLIHDVQNVLLRIQLRNEVMARLKGVSARRPPEPLPGREAPSSQRIAANFRHFRWWAEYLTAGWEKSGVGG